MAEILSKDTFITSFGCTGKIFLSVSVSASRWRIEVKAVTRWNQLFIYLWLIFFVAAVVVIVVAAIS